MTPDGRIAATRRLAKPAGVAALAACGCAAIWFGDPTNPSGPLPVCPVKALFGIDCPGCGSMRMLYSLMHGDLTGALRFNALGVVAVVLLAWAYLAWTSGQLVGRRISSWKDNRWAALVALVLVTTWFVARNVGLAPFV
jgi:hypothetical protein